MIHGFFCTDELVIIPNKTLQGIIGSQVKLWTLSSSQDSKWRCHGKFGISTWESSCFRGGGDGGGTRQALVRRNAPCWWLSFRSAPWQRRIVSKFLIAVASLPDVLGWIWPCQLSTMSMEMKRTRFVQSDKLALSQLKKKRVFYTSGDHRNELLKPWDWLLLHSIHHKLILLL